MSELAVENARRERFEVDNDMKAEWCLSKIRAIRKDQERQTAELDRQMKFYQDQKDILAHQADEDVAFFEGLLHQYFDSRIDAGFVRETKTKVSYKLPTGELMLKHREPNFDRDDEKVLDWLKKNGQGKYIKVKESLDWQGLKNTLRFTADGAAVDGNGEIIPGIKAVVRDDDFIVEVK